MKFVSLEKAKLYYLDSNCSISIEVIIKNQSAVKKLLFSIELSKYIDKIKLVGIEVLSKEIVPLILQESTEFVS